MRQRLVYTSALLVVLLAVTVPGGAAQRQAQMSGDEVLAALLVEVRGLRAAMEEMAAAGPRVQLALGRLQMQEQRINTMLRRQEEVTTRISSQEQQAEMLKQQLASRDERLARAESAEERQQLEKEFTQLKSMVDMMTMTIGQLRAEEAQLATSIGMEQSRWMEINAQLEALERSLRRD